MKQGLAATGADIRQTFWTQQDGFYQFSNLRLRHYYVTQTQPDNYLQGINRAGTLGGELDPEVVDRVILELEFEEDVLLYPDGYTDGMDYYFGERPPTEGGIATGQTASIGFWQNRNGQALIQSLNEEEPESIELGETILP